LARHVDAAQAEVAQADINLKRTEVQAPHCAMPQPNFVPVIPSMSRSTQRSGRQAIKRAAGEV
jgi:hypothetical protein